MRSFPHIQQPDSMECGATCLRMIAKYYGKEYSAETMRRLCLVTREGVSLLSMSDAAERLGFRVVCGRITLEKVVERFKRAVANDAKRMEAVVSYDIDEYDERFLRHLALGYTKEMIAALKGMPFGVKSLEKRQADLVNRLFAPGERSGVNATRLVVRALELRILDIDNLEEDEE